MRKTVDWAPRATAPAEQTAPAAAPTAGPTASAASEVAAAAGEDAAEFVGPASLRGRRRLLAPEPRSRPLAALGRRLTEAAGPSAGREAQVPSPQAANAMRPIEAAVATPGEYEEKARSLLAAVTALFAGGEASAPQQRAALLAAVGALEPVHLYFHRRPPADRNAHNMRKYVHQALQQANGLLATDEPLPTDEDSAAGRRWQQVARSLAMAFLRADYA